MNAVDQSQTLILMIQFFQRLKIYNQELSFLFLPPHLNNQLSIKLQFSVKTLIAPIMLPY